MKLLTRIKQVGVPSRIAIFMEENSAQSLDVDILRSVVGHGTDDGYRVKNSLGGN